MKINIFVVLRFINLLSFCCANNLTMGPYKAKVSISEACKMPSKPYDKNPALYFSSDVYPSGGKKLMKGNLTVVRAFRNLKIQAKGYVLDDGNWRIMNKASSEGCHGTVMRVIKFAFNVPSNAQSCIPKGMYTYKDLDFDAIQHMWNKSFMYYGRYLWRIEILSKGGTVMCWEYVSDVEIKKERKNEEMFIFSTR